MIGHYPTPVSELSGLATESSRLWVKRDDLTHARYGGSKVRKLEALLEQAERQRARRILTIGAVGSHHVLATAFHGTARGFQVAALLVPQPRTPHVEETVRASLASGLSAIPLRSYASVPLAVMRERRRDDFWIPLGGSCPLGSDGYRLAAHELAEQIARGELPEPEWIVVALGSGGTAAGLAAGLAEVGLSTRVLAVAVSKPVIALRFMLQRRLQELGLDRAMTKCAAGKLVVDGSYVGAGYGYATDAATRAVSLAHAEGLALDMTYTAKAFAAALALREKAKTILYWHTLASQDVRLLGPTQAAATQEPLLLTPDIARLLR